MTIRPLRRRLFIRLDEEDRRVAGGLYAPDAHFFRACLRCEKMMEALDGPCTPVDIVDLDARTDRYIVRGQDRSHEIVTSSVPVVVEPARWATVIAAGDGVPFTAGDRVLVDANAGTALDADDPLSPLRRIDADTVLAVLMQAVP